MTYQEPGAGSQQIPPAYAQPTAPVTYPAAYAGVPPQQPAKKAGGLALAALIVGIAAFLFGLIPVFGALVGVTGIVLAILALRKNQSKGMAIAGIILGSVAVIASISATVGIGAAVNNEAGEKPVVIATQAAEPAPVETVAPAPVEPAEEPVAAEPEAPAVPVEFSSALIKAASYSELMHMSKAGLYDQLTSEYGEQFSSEAAQYAVDNLQADWNANALAKAKSYQDTMAMSPEAIRDQLTSEYGEKFTPEEADYAILHLND